MRGFGELFLVGLVCVAGTFGGALPAAATLWNVPGNGSNVCTTINPNCDTIQQAVTAATGGDSISIGAGTFSGAGNESVVLDKALTISGAGRTSTFIAA